MINERALPKETILAGRYLIGEVLGEGGFGITYVAYDLKNEASVAIKEYFPNGLANRSVLQSGNEQINILSGQMRTYYEKGLFDFEKEARILAKLQGIEGIVQVEGFFRENNTAYMVMEYVQGISLKEYLIKEGKPLTEERCLLLMQPVIRALSCVHKEGIIHRDISPDNIIIKEDGSVVLIDFGSARLALGDETKSLTVLLKHGYAPVEQYQTRGKQGPWTDIYALCATMYRMVSGRVPNESIERLVDDELVALKMLVYKDDSIEVSEEFSNIIEKGMAVKGNERYQDMDNLMIDFTLCGQSRVEDKTNKNEECFGEYDDYFPNHYEQKTDLNVLEKIGNWGIAVIMIFFLILLIGVVFASANPDKYNTVEKKQKSIDVESTEAEYNMIKNGRMDFTDPTVDVGEIFDVVICLSTNDNIKSVNIKLKYDTDILEYIEGANFYGDDGQIELVQDNENQNELKWSLKFCALKTGETTLEVDSGEGTFVSGDMLQIVKGKSNITIQ